MFCGNCGEHVEEGSRFCRKCGANIEMQTDVETQQVQFEQQEIGYTKDEHSAKKKSVVGTVLGVLMTIFMVAVIGLGTTLYFKNQNIDKQKEEICKTIEAYEMEKYNTELKGVKGTWENLGFFDIAKKEEALKELEDIGKNAAEDEKTLTKWSEELEELESKKSMYDLGESYGNYKAALKQCGEVIAAKEVEEVEDAFEKAENVLQEVINENKIIVEEKLTQYRNVDLTFADPDEKTAYEEGIAIIENGLEKENFKDLKAQFESLDEITYIYAKPEKSLNLSVQQVDVSSFPNVKLYVQVEDAATKEVPKNLKQAMFYIGKADANGTYVKQVVSRVNQLNQAEALSVNMVADVSGSMYGTQIDEAKRIMSNFVRSVQFNVGDKVELISFSTGVYLEREFCAEPNLLINDIANLQTDDMTSLYDALYTAVTRTAARKGARCVIAFTDGADNYSNCDMDSVINVAQRYKVPIFIIGIGDLDTYAMSTIATSTGGKYYSVNQVGSMEDIYKEIYRQQKEMFVLEFVDTSNKNVTETSDIVIRYQSPEYGGESYQSYTPNILMSVGDEAFFKSGPEAVVEAYMKGFDDAMTYSDFSYIRSYLLVDSPIYKAQEKYVQKNISEMLDSYEIVDVVYKNNDECVVETRETYYVQAENKPLVLLTQKCKYVVVNANGEWKLKDFADKVHVLSKIKQ